MAFFMIKYGCGCSYNEDFIEAKDLFEAENIAYQRAIEDYDAHEGLFGIRGTDDIAYEEFCDEDQDIDSLTDEDWEEIEQIYSDEKEHSLNYDAKEITYKQYIHEDLYWEDDEDEDEEDVLD